jgi:hypothetical protein
MFPKEIQVYFCLKFFFFIFSVFKKKKVIVFFVGQKGKVVAPGWGISGNVFLLPLSLDNILLEPI